MADFFDKIRNNQKLIQFILAGVMLPFLFYGIDSYSDMMGHKGEVAKVGKLTISEALFERTVQEEVAQEMQNRNGKVPDNLAKDPNFRKAVLQQVINAQLSELDAKNLHLIATDQDVLNALKSDPNFSEKFVLPDGQLNFNALETTLQQQGMRLDQFEEGIRKQVLSKQREKALGSMGFVAKSIAQSMLSAVAENREVQMYQIKADDVLSEIPTDPKAVAAYYEKNKLLYKTPAIADLRYLVFDEAAAKSAVTVSDDEVKQFYEKNLAKYQTRDPRSARHILIAVDAEKGIADKAAARKKAEQVLAEVRANPAAFGDLAKKYSQDTGSAANGGDLGVVSAGQMAGAKAFEDTLFGLAKDQISDIVETDFGFHIIQALSESKVITKSLAEASPSIKEQLVQEKLATIMGKKAQAFMDAAKNQSKSIELLAKEFDLSIQAVNNVTLTGVMNQPDHLLNSPSVLTAIFAEDIVSGKKATPALSPTPNTLIVAVVDRYTPDRLRPLEEVKDQVTTDWKRTQATGFIQNKVKQLMASPERLTALTYGPVFKVNRLQSNLDRQSVDKIFAQRLDKVPAFVSADLGAAGYAIFKINGTEKVPVDDSKFESEHAALNSLYSAAVFNAANLWARDHHSVEVYIDPMKVSADPQ